MSTTDEKVRAQEKTIRFLMDLLDPAKTDVFCPKEIRERARLCLRHLATSAEVKRGAF